MPNSWRPEDLANQFDRIVVADVNGVVWYDCFTAAATKYNLPVAVLIAIGSRETHLENIVGDAGHGYGIMQIDIRYHHDFVTKGLWKDPYNNVSQGAQILSDMRASVAHWSGKPYNGQLIPTIAGADLLRVAIAGYNAGFAAIVRFAINGDPDLATTGHDYSEDVLARAQVFEDLIDARNNAGEKLDATQPPT